MSTFTGLLTTSSSSEEKVLSQSLRRRVRRQVRFPEDECRGRTRFVLKG
jgi:hypothetical protein